MTPDDYVQFAVARLRARRDRITQGRSQVIQALSGISVPLSAYGIQERVEALGWTLHVVSIYRILEALERAGLAHRVGPSGGYVPCRLGDRPGCHVHLICLTCGSAQEIASQELALELGSVERGQAAASRFLVRNCLVTFQGVCAQCGTAAGGASGGTSDAGAPPPLEDARREVGLPRRSGARSSRPGAAQ